MPRDSRRKSYLIAATFLVLGGICFSWTFYSWKKSSDVKDISQLQESTPAREIASSSALVKEPKEELEDISTAVNVRSLKSLQQLELHGPFKTGDRVKWSLKAGPGELLIGAAIWIEGESKVTKDQVLSLSLRKYKIVPGRYHLEWETETEHQGETILMGGFQLSEQKNIRKKISYILQQERKRFLQILNQFEAAPQKKWKKIYASTREFADIEKKRGTNTLRGEWSKLKPIVDPKRQPSAAESVSPLVRLKALKKDFLFTKVN